ncbi:hypothetical protein PAXRUDRAFT_146422 [Paxillus rubicundulus Ve08.2h10]|uniref:Uncharacterized protein n=1 Tax=Paxillus rubicundulus Ve08.2h10 TaxID=930991 RepID=A0A0D0DMI8_9AGAM|nr:hypothetical protein PAXRUDRAFT_146422 [Paxillus rubicundulus Ve08.2h10]
MSTQHLTISCPDLSQSILHMGLYYLGFQIESAVSHLIHQPDKYQPDNWQWLLDREFQLLHVMQQIHATCPTTAIPAPASQGIYHISHKNLQMALWAFYMWNCTMSTNIPTFLHNWDPMLVENLQGKWWDNNAEDTADNIPMVPLSPQPLPQNPIDVQSMPTCAVQSMLGNEPQAIPGNIIQFVPSTDVQSMWADNSMPADDHLSTWADKLQSMPTNPSLIQASSFPICSVLRPAGLTFHW